MPYLAISFLCTNMCVERITFWAICLVIWLLNMINFFCSTCYQLRLHLWFFLFVINLKMQTGLICIRYTAYAKYTPVRYNGTNDILSNRSTFKLALTMSVSVPLLYHRLIKFNWFIRNCSVPLFNRFLILFPLLVSLILLIHHMYARFYIFLYFSFFDLFHYPSLCLFQANTSVHSLFLPHSLSFYRSWFVSSDRLNYNFFFASKSDRIQSTFIKCSNEIRFSNASLRPLSLTSYLFLVFETKSSLTRHRCRFPRWQLSLLVIYKLRINERTTEWENGVWSEQANEETDGMVILK